MSDHEHYIPDEEAHKRFPDCACGEVYWSGRRWTATPDRSQYMDTLEGAAVSARLGVDR